MIKSPLAALLAIPFLGGAALSAEFSAAADEGAILDDLRNVSIVASTVPANGDVNPYGIARVPVTQGRLRQGHVLVSNFNNQANLQGTGTTIVDVAPGGAVSLFAQIDAAKLPEPCPGGVGLTTALVVLRAGWVVVGSLPTADGTSATAQAGCLIVLNNEGVPTNVFAGSPINGPWDMAAIDRGSEASVFFTNVLNGTVAAGGQVADQGTVVRLDLDLNEVPSAKSFTVIASGLPTRTDPAALVIGPTGLGFTPNRPCALFEAADCEPAGSHTNDRVLYVADTLNSRVAVIGEPLTRADSAGPGDTLSANGFLNGPLGLSVAPNGHILTVNANDGFISEIAPDGTQLAHESVDDTGNPPGAGTLFGVLTDGNGKIFFVDDGSNTLNLLH
ncbi:MAG TPA: hypothetical protein VGM32_21100 [Rhodopila sp.]|jgi:hypothetical protein